MRIIAVGKKHESWVVEGIERYQKRLKKPFAVEWVFLPHSARQGQEARENESETILSRLKPHDYILLLDEVGVQLTSPSLSRTLLTPLESSRPVVIIIGGAFGVTSALRERADTVWSLSPLVFPHQLVRLILIEQLYRAQEIARSGSYHHE